jgi:hypothetical protein
MDDLEILRALGGPDPVPDPATEARARTALLNRTMAVPPKPAPRRRWGRLGWRVGVPVAAASVALTALVVVENAGPVERNGEVVSVLPGLPAARPANAAEAVRYAADAAAQRPFATPRPDQWFYYEARVTSGRGPGGFVSGGPYHTETTKYWRRVDGSQVARYRDGKLVTSPINSPIAREEGTYPYAEIAALPANPDAVLAWVRKTVGGVGGGTRDGEDQIAFVSINAVLRDFVLPPPVEAAFFQALGRLSGVTLVPDAVNLDGRPALALARVQEGWLREEILLDPQTYRLIGERSVAIADHTVVADDGRRTVRKGTVQRYLVRVAAAIVDRPGQTG